MFQEDFEDVSIGYILNGDFVGWNNMQSELNRREFLGNAFRLGALFASLASWKTWFAIKAIKSADTAASVPHRLLVTEAHHLLDAFSNARGGELIYHCHMFFPTFITGHDVEKAWLLQDQCQQKLKEVGTMAESRLRSIPAIVAAHTLPAAEGDAAESMRQLFVKTHNAAISQDISPSRVLGLIWTSMTAAVLRTEHNWRNLVVGSDIINAARNICLDFTRGDDSAILLLHTAAAAWQFLLTYRVALTARSTPISIQELRLVNLCLSSVQNAKGHRYKWLNRIAELCSARQTYNSVLPEYMEVVAGRSQCEQGSDDRQAADFFVLLRLQTLYINHLLESGEFRSQYSTDAGLAGQLKRRHFSFLVDYGLSPRDWTTLKLSAQEFLTKDAIQYFDHVFAHFDSFASESGAGGQEARYAEWFSRHVPFRKVLPEELVAARVYGNPKVMESWLQKLRSANELSGQFSFCLPALMYGTHLATKQSVAKPNQNVILPEVKEAAENILLTPQYRTAFKLLAEQVQGFRKRFTKGHISTPTGSVPLGKAPSAQAGHSTLKGSSARLSLAGKGEVQSPEFIERRKMNTPPKPETGHTAINEQIAAVVPPLSAMMTLFGSNFIKVRFRNIESADLGFSLLYHSGHSVDAFGDFTFGLSSDVQLELLKKNNVQFEIVD